MSARHVAQRSAFGRLHERLADVFFDARRELDGRDYDELLAIAAAIVARLHRERLDRQERPS